MSQAPFDVGDLVRLTAEFRDLAGDLVAPTEVVCTVRPPAGEVETLDVSTDQPGIYTADLEITEAGQWRYAWDGTGSHQAAEEGLFQVQPRRVPRA